VVAVSIKHNYNRCICHANPTPNYLIGLGGQVQEAPQGTMWPWQTGNQSDRVSDRDRLVWRDDGRCRSINGTGGFEVEVLWWPRMPHLDWMMTLSTSLARVVGQPKRVKPMCHQKYFGIIDDISLSIRPIRMLNSTLWKALFLGFPPCPIFPWFVSIVPAIFTQKSHHDEVPPHRNSSPIMTLPHTSSGDNLWLSHLTEHFIITMYLTSVHWGETAEYVAIDLISGVESQGHFATTASKETINRITHLIEQIRVCRGTNRHIIM